jgi:hypothetical protein
MIAIFKQGVFMSSRTKIFGATETAKKKLEGGYKPFKKTKKAGCTSAGCGIKNTAGKATPEVKQENGAK